MEVLYEDNHIIIVNKASGEIVQGDKTGDVPLGESVKAYIKEKYAKPGNVFLGVTHRLDRPVSGIVVFARTEKGLSRMNALFRDGGVEKTYVALVRQRPIAEEGELTHWMVRNEKQNKSSALSPHRLFGPLLSIGCQVAYRPSSSDKMSVGCNGMSYQRGSQIWIPS